jgi:endonuclease/exonuclease/phosphatase (EEP) superfamily protein YafD
MIVRTLAALLCLATSGCISTREVLSLGTPSSHASTSTDSISHFICWNVHKADDQRFTREVKELLSTIPKEEGVILCLQEVRSSTYDLIRNLHAEQVTGHYAPSWRLPFSRRSTGVLTVANLALPASGAIPLRAPHREFYIASPKVSLRTATPIADGRTLEVLNCHGLNFVTISAFPKQLDKIFAALKDSDSPAIACGDFNVWSEERLQILNQKAREVGLVEAHTHGPEDSPAPQWLRGLKRFNGFDPDIRLDRIYTRGVEILDCRCHAGPQSSDHLPLILRYRIKPAI